MIGVFSTYVYLYIDQSIKLFLFLFLFPFSFLSVNFDEQKIGEALEFKPASSSQLLIQIWPSSTPPEVRRLCHSSRLAYPFFNVCPCAFQSLRLWGEDGWRRRMRYELLWELSKCLRLLNMESFFNICSIINIWLHKVHGIILIIAYIIKRLNV